MSISSTIAFDEWCGTLLIKIGSGNGFVPSGNKQLPDPTLTQIYVAIRRH